MLAGPDGDPPVPLEVRVESLDREGRGVAHPEGKALFVGGALPGERVSCVTVKRRPTYEVARLEAVLDPSPSRESPRCAHFGVCGGCALQHLELRAQVAAKQRVLEDAFERIGKVRAERMLSPVFGPGWAYRHRARFTVRRVAKKGGVLVGFHERSSSFVADMHACEVLPPAVSAQIPRLRDLVEGLSIRERLPQVEVAVGDRVTVLVLRVLEPPSDADLEQLRAYADAWSVQLWLQPGGPQTARPFWPLEAPALDYSLPDYGLRFGFSPTDFTQVNHAANRMLVRRAMQLLDPRPGEHIADFFCGLGNFSLPIARLGARVLGVEGSSALVARAADNAALNGLEGHARFEAADLFDPEACRRYAGLAAGFDKLLIDPPRDGAVELVKALGSTGGARPPARIVYVSCDPATLARDAGVLVHTLGYHLAAAGIVNMFPHTAHVESVALFEHGDGAGAP